MLYGSNIKIHHSVRNEKQIYLQVPLSDCCLKLWIKSESFQLYHGESRLPFDEMMSALY